MPKSILITGASSGIGRTLAFEFSRRGYALGLCARRLELLESLRDELGGETQVAIAKLDVADLERVPEVLHKLADQLGGVQIVIANAGVGERSYPGEGTFHLDSKVIEINVLGAMATIDAGTEILKKRGRWSNCRNFLSRRFPRTFHNSGLFCFQSCVINLHGRYPE